jgi:hypothetical protein
MKHPDVISATSAKCIAHFEVAQHEFSHMSNMGLGANRHGNMSCFGGGLTLILVNQKLHATKHEPQNLNLETYYPLKHFTFL